MGETGDPRGKPTIKPMSWAPSNGPNKLNHVYNFIIGEASESWNLVSNIKEVMQQADIPWFWAWHMTVLHCFLDNIFRGELLHWQTLATFEINLSQNSPRDSSQIMLEKPGKEPDRKLVALQQWLLEPSIPTAKEILMATFHAVNIISHSLEKRSHRLDP